MFKNFQRFAKYKEYSKFCMERGLMFSQFPSSRYFDFYVIVGNVDGNMTISKLSVKDSNFIL